MNFDRAADKLRRQEIAPLARAFDKALRQRQHLFP
jgi:hypothetical protein